MQSSFKIGELAKLYGVGTDTIRYYEEQGLITPQRGENGYRLYSIHDIWRMNVIRDLRALDFPVERIRAFLQRHSVESTLQLLDDELEAIDDRLRQLQQQRHNVLSRIGVIRAAETRPYDVIETLSLPTRCCREIAQRFHTDDEMDVLIKRLLNQGRRNLYIIGSAGIGARVYLSRKTGQVDGYSSTFLLDDQGPVILPGGPHLALLYRGSSRQTTMYVHQMQAYAEEHNLRLAGSFLEFIRIDIHESEDVREHVTELQVRLE